MECALQVMVQYHLWPVHTSHYKPPLCMNMYIYLNMSPSPNIQFSLIQQVQETEEGNLKRKLHTSSTWQVSNHKALFTTCLYLSVQHYMSRARASVFLSEGRWFDSPGLNILDSRYWIPNCSWCAGRHLAWQRPPSVYDCMYEYWKLLWTKASVEMS